MNIMSGCKEKVKMMTIFYIGFFITNFVLMNILTNIIEGKWIKDGHNVNEYFTSIMSILYSIGITLMYYGVLE